ncbi:hypothetical protein [Silvanigrella aquatica]|uniref:Uncharacterized protein n=1 Tax=Silvanigrella aquatica TaxID=1915309 RepID=A0A1L4D410_9BACT|nr:hypothetical protein [Silvanigrella aquatica]APJ04955.1 hypothetical protein AXG55_14060 [Silvanigrella aquatica]
MLKYIKSIPSNLSSDPSHSVDEDEPDRPPVLITAVIVVSSFVLLVLIALFCYTFLWKTTESFSHETITGMGNETLLNYEKNQQEILSSYKKLDNGNYQIPISQAMELVVKEHNGH